MSHLLDMDARMFRMPHRQAGAVCNGMAVLAAVALAVTACAGGSSELSADTAPIDDLPTSAEVAATSPVALEPGDDGNDPSLPLLDAIGRNVAEHGDAGAFAAVLIALDRGFTVAQIAEGESMATDGSIGNQQPAGPERGFLVRGPQGLVRQQQTVQLPEELNLRVEFLGSTINEIHGATWNRHQADVERAAREFNEEFTPDHVRLAWAVVQLVSRGYTPEQAIEGLVFGTVILDGPVCGRLPELPLGEPTKLDGCPPITESAPSTTTVPDGDAAPADQSIAEEDDTVGFEPGTFTGSAVGLLGSDVSGADGTTVFLADTADVEVEATSMSGTLDLLVQATSENDGDEGDLDDILDDTICVSLSVILDEIPLSDPDTGRFEGSGSSDVGFEFGNCPSGDLPDIQTVAVPVTADVDGDTLELVLEGDGETVAITLTRA